MSTPSESRARRCVGRGALIGPALGAALVELQLRRLRERLAQLGLGLELTDAAKEHLVESCWDPTYGARPLKRAIQRLVENPLALRLLEGEFGEGDTVRVDVEDGELVFANAPTAEPAAA